MVKSNSGKLSLCLCIIIKVLAVNYRYACALSNTFSPFKGYKMYKSINELAPYLSKPKKYFYEWQKRFFRALSWKIEGKK